MNTQLLAITDRIRHRSEATRREYLERCAAMRRKGPQRGELGCSNLAHGFASCTDADDKQKLRLVEAANIGIVTAYNDMLSAHQPLADYPEKIKQAAHSIGCTAQVAGGVPAMCDGVTQGAEGMELSLFSRDSIATATAIALSHSMFDAALCLGVCDKIVPGLLIGALSFGHLPIIFVPAGPMDSGLANKEKAAIRQAYAEGKVGRDALLEAESRSYHSPGTCTFYGTANSNQMLMEAMGLHIPGSAFVHPHTPLRDELTATATRRVAAITDLGPNYTPISSIVNEKAIVNALVALLATGGSTNHTIHWIAIARAAGILIDWDDYNDLSAITPLLARVYPNGSADVNHFQAAGGPAFVLASLLDAGLMHDDVNTAWGNSLRDYTREPMLQDDSLHYRDTATDSGDDTVLRPVSAPFSPEGGLRLLTGNIGRAVIKISAVDEEHQIVEAPAVVFDDPAQLPLAFDRGELEHDFIAVVRYQGPRANGMPELHKLTPYLGILQDRGFRVALITDGRMSGASGKVPAAIHLVPEADAGGAIAKLRDGDLLRLDTHQGSLAVLGSSDWQSRECAPYQGPDCSQGYGRELFSVFRRSVSDAESGASIFNNAVVNREQ